MKFTTGRRWVPLGVLATLVALAFLGWYTSYTTSVTRENADRALRIVDLRSRIIYLDEVLTMSSRMAALSGDLAWENRYRHFEPELDAAIQEAIQMVRGDINRLAAQRTDEANRELVRMENEAFRLIRSRDQSGARKVLFSTEYANQKQIYAKGMEDYASALTRVQEDLDESNRNSLIVYVLVIIVVSISIGLLWFVVSRRTRAKDAYMRAILESAADAIITMNEKGYILSCNHATERMFARRAEGMIGQSLSLLLASGEKALPPDAKTLDLTARRSDGSRFPVLLTLSRVLLEDQVVYTGILRDMTDRQKVEEERKIFIEELEGKNAELEHFNYSVSHDLKSPLVTIQGWLERLEMDAEKADGSRIREDVSRVRRAADQMGMLLEDLLEFSKVGRTEAQIADIPLSEPIGDAIELLQVSIREKKASVTVQEPLSNVRADRSRLLLVFQNLIGNAVKHAAGGQNLEIKIGCRPDNGKAEISIGDNGPGIPEEYRERVFGMFERLEPKSPGTGVGLALVKRIVEAHGGRVWIDSGPEKRGCIVHFTLPRGRGDA